jgi:hypothetical protein
MFPTLTASSYLSAIACSRQLPAAFCGFGAQVQ